MTIDRVSHDGKLLAIIIRASFRTEGIEFFTPPEFSQQLGYMKRPAKYMIPPHVHNPVRREVVATQEVLFVRKGKIRVDFYDEARRYLESRILSGGDIILLATGGHGIEVLEACEMIEVKQGPYAGDQDKSIFDGIVPEHVRVAGKESP